MGTILVVEDEPLIADFVRRGLRQMGHGTVTTDNVGDAVAQALAREDVDLVILDLALAGRGQGLSVLQAVRERKPWLPVIVVTGHSQLRDACLKAGATDFITKPFRFGVLARRVDAVLGPGDGEWHDDSVGSGFPVGDDTKSHHRSSHGQRPTGEAVTSDPVAMVHRRSR